MANLPTSPLADPAARVGLQRKLAIFREHQMISKSIGKTKIQRGGFTLMEVVFSIVSGGVAIVSLMMLFASGTTVNAFGNDLSTGVFLAEQLRAMTDQVPFADLTSYDDQTYGGVDAEGSPVAGLSDFQQHLSVRTVNPQDLTLYIGPDPQAAILTATVSRGAEQVTRLCWMRVR